MTSDESTNFWVDAPYNDRIPSLSPYRQYSTVRLSFPRPDEFSRLVRRATSKWLYPGRHRDVKEMCRIHHLLGRHMERRSLQLRVVGDHRRWQRRSELASAIFEYIEAFYNPRRRRSSIGNLSPVEFEARHTNTAVAA